MGQGNRCIAVLIHSKLQQGLASEQGPAWRDCHHMLQQGMLGELFVEPCRYVGPCGDEAFVAQCQMLLFGRRLPHRFVRCFFPINNA